MRTSTDTPDPAFRRRRRHLILLRPTVLLLRLQLLIALLDEELAFEELETFVDDTIQIVSELSYFPYPSLDADIGRVREEGELT
jgi:hypothetical protein